MSTGAFQKKKSLGQHFLTSDVVPKWMCDAGSVAEGDIVVEVGPGTGMLTKEILLRGARVIALEADQRAIEVLRETFADELASQRLTLHHTDVRELDLATLGIKEGAYKVVANIPYYLSGRLFRTFLDSNCQPSSLVFLVQKEVAERIARDEKESLLSLSVKAFGTPTYVRTVSRGHFSPPPKVDSAIIAVAGISQKNFVGIEQATFFAHLHIGFGERRKQLLGCFAKHYPREKLVHIFSTLDISPTVRGEDLPLLKWLELTRTLEMLDSPQALHR